MATSDPETKREKVAIIGCGLVGRSFAMIFAGAGYSVCIHDVDQDQIATGLVAIRQQLTDMERLGCLRGSLTVSEQCDVITTTTDLGECVAGAIYVQECVFEDLELKKKLFLKLDKCVGDDTIMASSSAHIFPSWLSENMTHRANLIVAHPVNPPYLVPLVEIVPSQWTDGAVVSRARKLMQDVGQSPIVVKKEVDGFVICRIQHAVTTEAFKLVQDGIASVEDVDKVMSEGLGMRYAFMGAFETCFLNAPNGFRDFCERFSPSIYTLQQSYGPPVKMEGETRDHIHDEIAKRVPLESIDERRKWRDECLVGIRKLKQAIAKMDADQPSN